MKRIMRPPALPPRPRDGHKGLFGRVLIVGGSEEMIGAPVLAGLAALRMGAGLVQVALPASVLAAALSAGPELVGLALGRRDDAFRLQEAAEAAEALVIGPGLGQSARAVRTVRQMITVPKPRVVDADALNILAKGKSWPGLSAGAVLTPHPGEMRRLLHWLGRKEMPSDEKGRVELATHAARSFGQTLVLKGHRTVVTDGRHVYINRTGNSALSKAGTGDVLAGMIAALLGQGMSAFDAAAAGVYHHGRAGEAAGHRLGLRGVLARDVIDAIPLGARTPRPHAQPRAAVPQQ